MIFSYSFTPSSPSKKTDDVHFLTQRHVRDTSKKPFALTEEMRPNDWQSIHQKYVPGSVKSLAFSCPEPLMLAVGGGDELGVLTLLVPRRTNGELGNGKRRIGQDGNDTTWYSYVLVMKCN